jgi:exodeoxyribonuclease VII large subunit
MNDQAVEWASGKWGVGQGCVGGQDFQLLAASGFQHLIRGERRIRLGARLLSVPAQRLGNGGHQRAMEQPAHERDGSGRRFFGQRRRAKRSYHASMAQDFFQFKEKIAAQKRAAAKPQAGEAEANTPWTVTELTNRIDRTLKAGFAESLLVRGELSNFSRNAASGHLYFSLKDAESCIDCVMWKSDSTRLKFLPSDGMELVVGGRIGVYGKRGRYQLYVTTLRPVGQGALELAFQQMRAKLAAEGLFNPERKRPIPNYPMTIVLVSSRDGAGLQDMLKVLRRFAWLRLRLFATPVQGDGAAAKIAAALACLSPQDGDVVLLARGGGSLEDLWAFNEEVVARAVAACRIPVITGIGHEVDVSIADLVADYHAHTPTEAAQVATAHWRGAHDAMQAGMLRLNRAVQSRLQEARQSLLAIERHEIFRRPMEQINLRRQFLDDRQRALTMALQGRLRRAEGAVASGAARLAARHPRLVLELNRQRIDTVAARMDRGREMALMRWQQRLSALEAQLESLSPEAVLRRGYSLTTRPDGRPIRSAAEVRPGDRLLTRLADGTVKSIAQDSAQMELFDG